MPKTKFTRPYYKINEVSFNDSEHIHWMEGGGGGGLELMMILA